MLARRTFIVVAMTLLSFAATASASGASDTTPVSVQVLLNTTTIHAGHSIHGTAILMNSSSTPIVVQAFNCYQWLYVGLANKKIQYDPAVPASACPNAVTLKPGVTRVPITVSTKYNVCRQGSQKGTIEVPHCTKAGMPSLPKGTYRVVVITNGVSEFAPYSSRVRVTLS